MKLWLFLVEGNSDKIYIDKIIKYYVKSEKLKKEIKLEWIILDGKYNYDKKEKQIKQKIDKFKSQNRSSNWEIIYVIDLDKFRNEEKDRIFLADIKKFIQKNKYKLIKNNENIEMVLKLDNKAKNKKEKVKIAELPIGKPLYPIPMIFLSSSMIHAPTCVEGSLLLIPDKNAIPIKYSSHDK